MPEPLIGSDHVVGSWDADANGWSARDFTPGPAGSVGLALPGGVEVDVDVAAPSILVGLWAPSRRGRSAPEASRETMATLVALLGRGRAAELLSLAKPLGPPRILRSGSSAFDRSNRRREPGTPRRSGRSGVMHALARTALALDMVDRPSTSTTVAALASLDAALAQAQLDEWLDFVDRARRTAADAAELLLSAVATGEIQGQPISARELADGLRRLLPLLEPSAERAISSLLHEVEAGELDLLEDNNDYLDDAGDSVALAMDAVDVEPMRLLTIVPEAPRPAGIVLDVVDAPALPERFARDRVAARATTSSEIEVRMHGRAVDAAGWWARAFNADDVIVAAAPLRSIGPDALARLLVPPALLRSVTIDITDAPGQPRTPQRLRAVAEAVATGRAAARAERLGKDRLAGERWRTAATAWSQADDQARAGLAAEYSLTPEDDERVPPPLLADALVEAES